MNNFLVLLLSKSLITFGTVLAIAYSAVCLFLWAAQGKFIFVPARAIETTPDDWQLKYQDVLLPIPTKTGAVETVHGWWIPASKNPRKVRGEVREAARVNPSVVLYLHGNGSNVGANVEHANRFHRLGFSVFLIDYRGYGKSQGDFPSESGVYEDTEFAWDYLVKQRGIHPNQIYIYGHSLGGAIAIDLAVRHPEAAGLIVESSFTSVREMVDFRQGLFWMFPIDFLLTQRFDSLSKVDRLQMPVLFIHGTADTVVPSPMSKKLFDAAPEPKQLYMVPGGGHNNVAEIGGAEYLQRLSQFWDIPK
ncbi:MULTISPECIES: alpha/beta hydrolase [unclassified Microcoleus]|uniref:alpha/beta hydrolase n=1 Tax=unclassified Microcoleus TaxID=2642155 RepID=UPI002FD02717